LRRRERQCRRAISRLHHARFSQVCRWDQTRWRRSAARWREKNRDVPRRERKPARLLSYLSTFGLHRALGFLRENLGLAMSWFAFRRLGAAALWSSVLLSPPH